MAESVQVYKMVKYRLYRCDKKDQQLRHMIFVASLIWNHLIALQRCYYRLTKKYISLNAMRNHVLKLRNQPRFALWKDLYSQCCQEVCNHIDTAYQRFFNGVAAGRPKFRKAKKYASFTFPQSGYKMLQYNHNHLKDNGKYGRVRSVIQINGVKYKFIQHRPLHGELHTLTVKRDPVGRLWLVFSVSEQLVIPEASTGNSGGFDFGLKDFLVDDDGKRYASPEFYKQGLRKIQQLQRDMSCKMDGSKRYKRARRALAKQHGKVANQRREHHYKLAHEICKARSLLYFEDLNLAGMKALWGRKVSDLGFAKFLKIVEWVAFQQGKTVVKIDRFTPTTKTCSACGKLHALTLRERTLVCDCGLTIDRDHNAAINIQRVGASTRYQSVAKTRGNSRRRGDGRSSRL
jgi:putative transposase